ncbi:MAG: ABC transporter ATP-binding protein, partial [Pseudomonadota bacterium]
LSGASLAVQPGEAVAVVGASGSGKSTLLGLLAGLDLPDSGSVSLGDTELTALDEDARARLRACKVGFVFQAFHLLDDLTAEENVALPLELFGHPKPAATARHWLGRLGLEDRRKHFPKQLSGGEQQRVALCRAFALQPLLLFADEPTANLDRQTAQGVIDNMFDLRRATGTAMVLVTHDTEVAARCDRIYHLDEGRLSEQHTH